MIVDDNIDEDEQSFAIIAEIESDVPDAVACFQIEEGQTDCFGRRGATEIRITDNDRKYNTQLQATLQVVLFGCIKADHNNIYIIIQIISGILRSGEGRGKPLNASALPYLHTVPQTNHQC